MLVKQTGYRWAGELLALGDSTLRRGVEETKAARLGDSESGGDLRQLRRCVEVPA